MAIRVYDLFEIANLWKEKEQRKNKNRVKDGASTFPFYILKNVFNVLTKAYKYKHVKRKMLNLEYLEEKDFLFFRFNLQCIPLKTFESV